MIPNETSRESGINDYSRACADGNLMICRTFCGYQRYRDDNDSGRGGAGRGVGVDCAPMRTPAAVKPLD